MGLPSRRPRVPAADRAAAATTVADSVATTMSVWHATLRKAALPNGALARQAGCGGRVGASDLSA